MIPAVLPDEPADAGRNDPDKQNCKYDYELALVCKYAALKRGGLEYGANQAIDDGDRDRNR